MTRNFHNQTHSCLDLARLEKIRHTGGKLVARCPACAEIGGDRTGNHLSIFPSGKFACAAVSGDPEHRRRIFALVGVVGELQRDPEEERQWRLRRVRERQAERGKAVLVATAREKRAAIIARHAWEPLDVWTDSPQRIDGDLVEYDPRHFLSSLYPPGAVLWTGELHESGQNGKYAHRWLTCAEWQAVKDNERVGPMVTPATWQLGTTARERRAVLTAPFTVLDFDGFDGVKPETSDQISEHLGSSLAIIRVMRECLSWKLAAILHTGGKSLHAWFHTPPPTVLQSLKDTAVAFGIDAGLIGAPSHCCRLPGHRHAKTGKYSRVLWLQLPAITP